MLKRPIIRLVLLYRRMRYGYAFRLIRMTQPKYAKVDPCDYERLRKFEWFAKKGRKSFYALRYAIAGKKGKQSLIYMHQMLIQVPDGMVIDHVNQDGMDNRTANLRAAT
ncbi:MAG: HNH endonuclease, partial [Planctomycetota bacterium]